MKREEILAMAPGEELDEIVSREVFGVEMVAHVPYSTDISAAWEVVEKMYNWGGCDIGCYGKGGSGKWITVSTRTFSAGDVRVTAHTAPEAICKAALLAVLEEEEA